MAAKKDKFQKKKLYRKVNSKAYPRDHHSGPDFKHQRNTKVPDYTMKQGVRRGLDYTPLFKFLLSKVGENYDKTVSEAISRLDGNKDGLNWIMDEAQELIRIENSYFSTLYKAEDGTLQKVNPSITVNDCSPWCDCCTHSFNGKIIKNKSEY